MLSCALQAKFLPFQSQSMRIKSQKLEPTTAELSESIQLIQMDVSNFPYFESL